MDSVLIVVVAAAAPAVAAVAVSVSDAAVVRSDANHGLFFRFQSLSVQPQQRQQN